MSLARREEIGRGGRVGLGCYEDPGEDVRNKSCVSGPWNLENDTTHGQTDSTAPRQTAGRPIRFLRGKLNDEVARHADILEKILARNLLSWNLSYTAGRPSTPE